MKFTKSAPLWGEITVPGDKSISHRAVMLGSLAGDDTAFLVMRDTESAASFCEEIKEML